MAFVVTVRDGQQQGVIDALDNRGIYCEYVAHDQVSGDELIFVDDEDQDAIEWVIMEDAPVHWFKIEDSEKYEDVVL